MAVRYQRAHPPRLSEGQGLLIVGGGLRDLGGSGVGRDGAKLIQRERLVPTLVLPGQVERWLCRKLCSGGREGVGTPVCGRN